MKSKRQIEYPNTHLLNIKPEDFPCDVIVETCAFCNLSCAMCPHKNMKRKKGVMEIKTWEKIIDEVAEENLNINIWMAIMGEPLMAMESLGKELAYAQKKGLKNIHLNTNGILLDESACKTLLDGGIKSIIFGVDAFTKQAYERIRVGGDFGILKKNIHHCIDTFKKHSCNTKLIVQFIEMEENENEIEPFKEYWLAQGATVKVRPRLGWGNGVSTDFLDKCAVPRNFPCPWLLRTFSIHWDGTIAQCDADYEGTHNLGNINNTTIRAVWDGEHARRRAQSLKLDFSNTPCDTCKDWSAGRSLFYNGK